MSNGGSLAVIANFGQFRGPHADQAKSPADSHQRCQRTPLCSWHRLTPASSPALRSRSMVARSPRAPTWSRSIAGGRPRPRKPDANEPARGSLSLPSPNVHAPRRRSPTRRGLQPTEHWCTRACVFSGATPTGLSDRPAVIAWVGAGQPRSESASSVTRREGVDMARGVSFWSHSRGIGATRRRLFRYPPRRSIASGRPSRRGSPRNGQSHGDLCDAKPRLSDPP